MVEGIFYPLIVAAILGIAGIARIAWKHWTSPVVVHSTQDLPPGVGPNDPIAWVGLGDSRARVRAGPLKRQEWHFRDESTHMVLIWTDRSP